MVESQNRHSIMSEGVPNFRNKRPCADRYVHIPVLKKKKNTSNSIKSIMQRREQQQLPTPPLSPIALATDNEPVIDPMVFDGTFDLGNQWDATVLERMAHSNIMTNQALDAYADSLFLEKQAKCWRAQVLKQQLVPNLIQLAHVTFGTRPNAATYETMVRQLTRSVLQAKNMIHLYQPIWRELARKDEWIEENAGGPAFPGPRMSNWDKIANC
ncbi:hypothetical protein BCR42DRAFT_398194 [Absidia repens]|uniref:Uncharacterized protein n=1 Tax=Absidia repens TaxID=90262 RepID=A0A1X2HYX6_9FUNG|nr:hypothetical protein BCR42DRAFT_398194 [Absidia repens]